MHEDLLRAIRTWEAELRFQIGDEQFAAERDYWRGIFLYGHGVLPGKYHQVNRQIGDIDIYLPGSTCLHCNEVVT